MNRDTSCPAIIVLRDRRSYEGHASIEGAWVHFEGRRRVLTDGEATYRPAGERSWPRRVVAEIRWGRDQT